MICLDISGNGADYCQRDAAVPALHANLISLAELTPNLSLCLLRF